MIIAGCSQQPSPPEPRPDVAADAKATETEDPNSYENLEKSAMAGDYQAQRNLAYTLTTDIPYNPILGCAWRIVILESGSPQVDQSDTANKQADCDRKLDADGLKAAQAQAKALQGRIQAQ